MSKTDPAFEAVLADLPGELRYLHDAVRAIAQQDPELIGCGEMDLTPLKSAVVARFGSEPTFEDEQQYAQDVAALDEWLSEQPEPTTEGPATDCVLALWALLGAMQSMSAGDFADLSDDAARPPGNDDAAPPNAAPPTSPIAITPLDGWTVGQEAEALVLKTGKFKVILVYMNASQAKLLQKQYAMAARMPGPPGTRIEAVKNVSLGPWTGLALRNWTGDAITGVQYVLVSPHGGLMALSHPARKDISAHLPALETMLAGATLR